VKRGILLGLDSSLILISIYAAFALRFGTATPFDLLALSWPLFPLLLAAGIPLILFFRLPSIKLNAFENNAMLRIGATALGLTATASVISYVLDLNAPRSVPIILGSAFFFGSVIAKLLGSALLHFLQSASSKSVPVAIYGAGAAGIQLASALRQSKEVRPAFFVDDNPSLHGLLVAGLKVNKPDILRTPIMQNKIKQVAIAIPSLSKPRQQGLVDRLQALSYDVQILPSYVDLLAGSGTGTSFRTVAPDELLGRDKVDLEIPEIAKAYAGRSVMVTGAGGSIGSELCRQLLHCRPKQLVLFEQSEFGLYQINHDLRPLAEAQGIDIVARLGSVTNKPRVLNVIRDLKVDIILHAAAYKHVPLVEENELEGARNNVLGTHIVANAAIDCGVERFILVSTDKAVRPTNVMGATKRMAELVVQDVQTRSGKTKLSMVRFGNVLGSSGSVLPLFQTQIAMGGPVTVAHPDATRIFRTTPEAARLILLAGAYSEGGDVFVLDVGQSKKVSDIARQMIQMSGHQVKEPGTNSGGIEILFTGLRPGEKLYERGVLDDKSQQATPHAQIMRANEVKQSQIEVAGMLKDLQTTLDSGDVAGFRKLIKSKVDGYHQQEDVA
jgi:FlaA1/EpsC-like NDP-sugar epimerase